MRRKQAYLVILDTHVDEVLAIARIVRSRARRRLAELTLAHERRRRSMLRTLLQQHRRARELFDRIRIGTDR